MNENMEYFLPTAIYRGTDIINNAVSTIKEKGCKKVLILVCPSFVNEKKEHLESLISALESLEVSYVLETPEHIAVTTETRDEYRKKYISSKCDCILAVGCPGIISVAKAVVFSLKNDKKKVSFYTMPKAKLGCSSTFFLLDSSSYSRIEYKDISVFPEKAFYSPDFISTANKEMGTKMLLSVLLDLLEAYLSPSSDTLTRRICLSAAVDIKENISKYVKNPEDTRYSEPIVLSYVLSDICQSLSSHSFLTVLKDSVLSLFPSCNMNDVHIALSVAYFNRIATSKKANKDLIELSKIFDPSSRSAFSLSNSLQSFYKSLKVEICSLQGMEITPKDHKNIARKALTLVEENYKDFHDPISYSYRDIVNILEESM